MMASELRIGNWVNNGKWIQVSAKQIYDFDKGVYDLLPIKLSGHWLENFGFDLEIDREYDPATFTYIKKFGFGWRINAELNYYRDDFFLGGFSISVDDPSEKHFDGIHLQRIDYVHQMQNIYFGLTGRELEIKKYASSKEK